VEDLSLDRSALEDPTLWRIELVETCGQQRLQSRRHHDLAVRVGGNGDHLLCEQRVTACHLHNSPTKLIRHPVADESFDINVGERFQLQSRRPARPSLEQLGPGHAQQQDRSTRREQRDVLDQIEERLLAPLDVVEDCDERALCSDVLERLAIRPGDLLARPGHALPQHCLQRLVDHVVDLWRA
jgi:hypothetical protein